MLGLAGNKEGVNISTRDERLTAAVFIVPKRQRGYMATREMVHLKFYPMGDPLGCARHPRGYVVQSSP
jgi:hypothetical protein